MPDHLKQHEILHEQEDRVENDRSAERIVDGDKAEEEDESINGGSTPSCPQHKKNTKKTKTKTTTSGKAKQLLLLPFGKFEQLRNRSRKKAGSRKPPPPSPSPPPHPNPYGYDDDPDLNAAASCYLGFILRGVPPCLRPPSPPVGLRSTAKPPASFSSSTSSHDFLKTLIQNNDFYSDDCNVHRDVRRPVGN